MNRRIYASLVSLALLFCFSAPSLAQARLKTYGRYMTKAKRFLESADPRARGLLLKRSSRASTIALGMILEKSSISQKTLLHVINNPHTFAPRRDGLKPLILPALTSLARVSHLPGVPDILKRAAKSKKNEGGTRGALFELVAGASLKRMGYKLDGLSFNIGKYETDGVIHKERKLPTLVNMKSVTDPAQLSRTVSKAEDQLSKRNGTVELRKRSNRNPGFLVIGPNSNVKLDQHNWKNSATKSGSDLTVISVDPNRARGKVIFSSAKNP